MLSRLAERFGLDALGVLATVLYALPSLAYPFGMDQPVHWYIGKRWLEGLMPYATGVDTKPPGVFAIHALSVLLLGDHQWSVRVVDLACVLATGALVATFRTRRLEGSKIVDTHPRRDGELGAACVLVGGLTYTFFDWTSLGHSDLWQGTLMLLAGWVVVRAPGGEVTARRALAAGAVAALAVTLKHVAFVSGVVFGGVVVALALRRGGPREALSRAGAYTAGVALVLGLTLLPFVLTGTLGAFREVMVDLILRYAAAGSRLHATADAWPTYAHGLLPLLVAPAMALGGLAVARLDGDRAARTVGWMALLALACGVGSVVMQGRGRLATFGYLWLAAVPALALGVAFGLRQVASPRGGAQLAAAVALTAIAFVAAPPWLSTPYHDYRAEWVTRVAWARRQIRDDEVRSVYTANQPTLDSDLRQSAVAARIHELARPGDTLCLDGFFGSIHQQTGLDCPSRFFIPPRQQAGALPAWFDEYDRMFVEHPPTFFVTAAGRRATVEARLSEGYVIHEVEPVRPRLIVMERRR